MKCEHCGNEAPDRADRTSCYWMWDNHTFSRLDGTIEEMIAQAVGYEEKDHWGMLCPVIVLAGQKELRRVGACTHGRGDKDQSGFIESIEQWKSEILADEDVRRLISAVSLS